MGAVEETTLREGAAYVVDGAGLTASNVATGLPRSAMSAFDIRLHVLSAGDSFDAAARRPVRSGRVA